MIQHWECGFMKDSWVGEEGHKEAKEVAMWYNFKPQETSFGLKNLSEMKRCFEKITYFGHWLERQRKELLNSSYWCSFPASLWHNGAVAPVFSLSCHFIRGHSYCPPDSGFQCRESTGQCDWTWCHFTWELQIIISAWIREHGTIDRQLCSCGY